MTCPSLWSSLLSPVSLHALAQQDPDPIWNIWAQDKRKINKTKQKNPQKQNQKNYTADLGKGHTLGVTLKQLFANGLEINACLKYVDNNNLNSSLLSFEPLPFFCLLYTMRSKLHEHLRHPLTLDRFYDSVRIYQLYLISLEDSTLEKMV